MPFVVKSRSSALEIIIAPPCTLNWQSVVAARKSKDRPEFLSGKRHKPVPHEFVLDALAPAAPFTRLMFGSVAVYVEDKIVLVLRDRPTHRDDNGVWLATTREHHDSLREEFAHMRSIALLSKNVTGWQVLPTSAPDFEESALRACQLILAGDPRIGKVPKPKPERRAPPKRSGA
jgi:hypothetical protein